MADWSAVTDNLISGLETFNSYYSEIVSLIQRPIESYNPTIYRTIVSINGSLQSVGLSLLVIFAVTSMIKNTAGFDDLKRPERILRMFVRFAIGYAIIVYGMDLLLQIFNIGLGVVNAAVSGGGSIMASLSLPGAVYSAIDDLTFIQGLLAVIVSFVCSLAITAISFIILLTVYGRFFKVYMFLAIAPIPLSTFAGEGTTQIGWTFLKSFMGVCLEGALIVISCIIFKAYAASSPISVSPGADAMSQIMVYMGGVIFQMLVLMGIIKACDRIVKEMGF